MTGLAIGTLDMVVAEPIIVMIGVILFFPLVKLVVVGSHNLEKRINDIENGK